MKRFLKSNGVWVLLIGAMSFAYFAHHRSRHSGEELDGACDGDCVVGRGQGQNHHGERAGDEESAGHVGATHFHVAHEGDDFGGGQSVPTREGRNGSS